MHHLLLIGNRATPLVPGMRTLHTRTLHLAQLTRQSTHGRLSELLYA